MSSKKIQKYSYTNLVDFRSSRVSTIQNKTNTSSSCDWYLVDYYWRTCSGIPLSCNYEYQNSEYVYLCDGTGNELPIDFIAPGEGGGGGAMVIDCNNVINGEAFYNTDCNTCIGGDTGVFGCPADLIDSLQGFDCAQKILDTIPNLKDEISQTITGVFGSSNILNLVFKPNSSISGTLVDGIFDGPIKPRAPGIYSYGVSINTDVLEGASKEYILATMYHEALHAYLYHMSLTMTPTEYNSTFNVSLSNGRLVPVDSTHAAMVGFTTAFENAILNYNSSFGARNAKALARAGIVNLNSALTRINFAERNTADTVTYGKYKGQKCP